MSDGTESEADASVSEPDLLEMRRLQSQGRLDVPNSWIEELEWEQGEKLHLVLDDDTGSIRVMKATPENIL